MPPSESVLVFNVYPLSIGGKKYLNFYCFLDNNMIFLTLYCKKSVLVKILLIITSHQLYFLFLGLVCQRCPLYQIKVSIKIWYQSE